MNRNPPAQLVSYYLSRDRVLSLVESQKLPAHVLAALQGLGVSMSSAILSNACRLLEEHEVPSDWGGEESDIFTANLLVAGARRTGAFLLKGPAAFRAMTLKDCGKWRSIYRLFNIPADIYVVQHCHHIGPAVRKTVEAFAMQQTFNAPCRYAFMDGIGTARLLRAHGLWKTAGKQS